MDSEKLIKLVEERRYLWDQREANYHIRKVQKELWEEVAAEMNENVENVKKRWRGLRDTFRKEFQKPMKLKNGIGGDESMSRWPFFNQLSFLAEMLKLRGLDFPSVEEDRTDEDTANESAPEDEELPPTCQLTVFSTGDPRCQDHSDHLISVSPAKKRKRSRRPQHSDCDDKSPGIESSKVPKDYWEEKKWDCLDEDYHFLLSLLSHLQDIPKGRKLRVRTEIMRVVMDELDQRKSAIATPGSLDSS